MKNFITRAITGVLFVACVVASFLDPIGMTALFALITGMTLWEFTGLVNMREKVKVNRFICTAAGVYLFLAVMGFCSGIVPSAVFIPYLLTVVYLFVSELYTRNEDAINDWAYTMLSQLYIALPFSCINMLAFRASADGMVMYSLLLPLSVYIFLWINDTGAYCTGSLLGKHKLFPRISPGKSWEGSIGGGIFVVLVSLLIAYIDNNQLLESWGLRYGVMTGLTTLQWVGLGIVVVFFGTWGDLVESLFKRTIGIKDSGTILPGHGGMLDRFDSSLMAIPAAVVYLYSITLI
ncbi:MAG: phosphatidate cytidylyltransferase [Bacteroidales bacterium]|nr:phosphatidate cytidylyltransferase [Bacteroidales bacterium]